MPIIPSTETVENIYKKKNRNQTLDFQVFFNDLIDNDFNTLFRNLPSNRRYLVAGVPGSFYTCLFPKKSIHFAHFSTSLHWLSGSPIEGRKSGKSKGRIHYLGGEQEVKEAYAAQYEEDFGGVLKARGDELVDGGLIVLVVLGFGDGVDSSESSIGIAFEILGSCLEDMAMLGKITKELKAIIEANGSFDIKKIAELGALMRHNPDPQVVTSHLSPVIGVLVEQHFGNGVVDELFKFHFEKLVKSPILVDEKYWKKTNYFVFLKKK
ncbi:Loganate O-methyltransferase [Handroanthus impetiginosus]|uniref:Loganate O-methyltransferase n=1 Tax=Handroanthus impetiginosus TaxID=429701 RepID=A0A2G9H7Q4_9LAMI|nr:Loganate O-methyltransferase [Handroanthus impetiginosus]